MSDFVHLKRLTLTKISRTRKLWCRRAQPNRYIFRRTRASNILPTTPGHEPQKARSRKGGVPRRTTSPVPPLQPALPPHPSGLTPKLIGNAIQNWNLHVRFEFGKVDSQITLTAPSPSWNCTCRYTSSKNIIAYLGAGFITRYFISYITDVIHTAATRTTRSDLPVSVYVREIKRSRDLWFSK
jgi:hypothetical protein